MNSGISNWFLVAILLPVITAVFRTEIGNLWKAWRVFKKREYDPVKNPHTEGRVLVQSGATGEWGELKVEKYVFSVDETIRGVYVVHPDTGPERITLLDWDKLRKRPALP